MVVSSKLGMTGKIEVTTIYLQTQILPSLASSKTKRDKGRQTDIAIYLAPTMCQDLTMFLNIRDSYSVHDTDEETKGPQ